MPESALSLADVIRRHRDQIVLRFVCDVERDLVWGLSRPMLVDHIPVFLEDAAHDVEVVHLARSVTMRSTRMRSHASMASSAGRRLLISAGSFA